jgi:energy-coupling factor transporter ATP-binding protein EcfA2
MENGMKIVSLEVENLMRLKAVEINPDGSMVVIGGKNGQGKTSLLNSIEFALGGTRGVCDRPIRDGKNKAKIVVDLGDLVVTRTFTASGGGTLTVKGKDGLRYGSPQKILDELKTRLTFDPLAFMRLGKEKQRDLFMELAGLDFSKLNEQHKMLTDERRDENRELKSIEHVLESKQRDVDRLAGSLGCEEYELPTSKKSADDIERDLEKANEHNRENEDRRAKHQHLIHEHDRSRSHLGACAQRVADLETELLTAKKQMESASDGREDLYFKMIESKKEVDALQDIDTTEITARFKTIIIEKEAAEAVNAKKRVIASMKTTQARIDDLNAFLDAVPIQKQKMIDDAELPIDGLSFTDDGVTYKNIPFSQCSSAEQLRVSVAMGVAMNPKLRVFLVRDGSLLDKDSMALLRQLAEENDVQVWVERVGKGQECQVIIEDGQVIQ